MFYFDVVAHPSPNITFAFLDSSSREVKDIDLAGHCEMKDGELYVSTCVVMVDSVTSSSAGLYMGTVKNCLGSAVFVFDVEVKGR